MKKRGFHFPALGGLLGALGGIAAAVVSDPNVIQSAAGKLGVSVGLVSAVVLAVTKPLRKE